MLVEEIKRRGLWQVAVAYAALATVLLAVTWGLVAVLDISPLYVRLTGVFAFMGLPMALGLAWALRQPMDPDGKGHVVRE